VDAHTERAEAAAEVARRYAELFNEGRYGDMGRLFAPDSVWRRPGGAPEIRGGTAIAAVYGSPEHAAQCAPMRIVSARYVADAGTAAAEFVFEGNGHASHVVDLFDVDEQGRITAMTVFSH
jgi:ketosteroid isomerase-like protein